MHKSVALFLFLVIFQVQAMEMPTSQAKLTAEEAKIKQSRLNSGLLRAAFEGDYKKTHDLLAQGAQPNPTEKVWYYGMSSTLSAAAYAKSEETCKLLIDHDADVNTPDHLGITPLMWAAGSSVIKHDPNSSYTICKLFIDHGAAVNAMSITGKTALIYAINADDQATAQLLIANGAINETSALIEQAKNMPTTELTFAQKSHLNSTLTKSARSGDLFKLSLLLAAGIHRFSDTSDALINAVLNNQLEACTLLLKHGANQNLTSHYSTPLMTAACYGHDTICKLFLEHGADLKLKILEYSHVDLALKNAIWAGENRLTTTKLFLEHGANANAIINGRTPLMRAVVHYELEICQLLLEYGASLATTIKDADGKVETAMTLAATHRNRDVYESLIVHSRFPACSLPDLKDSQYRTRLRLWAMKQICPHMPKDVKMLILSADSDVWEDACRTPLRMLANRRSDLILMPRQVVSKGIHHGAFELEQCINVLTTHKIEQLKVLTREARAHAHNPQILFNPDLLEQNYGKQIREIISKDCLGE